MTKRFAAVLAATAIGVAASGCGFGAGGSQEGAATLRVTRDYGTELMLEATARNPAESETVIRLLDREAELETRYGGGFVQAIEGLSGGTVGGRSTDWFFYVDGVESSAGAAEVAVEAGSRIWWDHRDWTDAMRVPAVVGSWPEPFAQVPAEAPDPVVLDCRAPAGICDVAAEGLADEGVSLGEQGRADAVSDDALRLVVGEWAAVRDHPAAELLDSGPGASGVFAAFERAAGAWELDVLDELTAPARSLGPGSGLVAALREGDGQPVWLVTGTDATGVQAALELLDEEALRDRYAVATDGQEEIALPVIGG